MEADLIVHKGQRLQLVFHQIAQEGFGNARLDGEGKVGAAVKGLIDLRINYIANMLRNSNHPVTQIIFESGFNNISWASE